MLRGVSRCGLVSGQLYRLAAVRVAADVPGVHAAAHEAVYVADSIVGGRQEGL